MKDEYRKKRIYISRSFFLINLDIFFQITCQHVKGTEEPTYLIKDETISCV